MEEIRRSRGPHRTKTYIVRALLVGIPTAAMFACTWIRPELFAGDANIFIISFMVLGTLGFVSLISLAIRRLSDIGLSHLYYWGFFGFLFISNQAGAKLLSDELLATRITGMFFFAAVILLAFIPGQKTKTNTDLYRSNIPIRPAQYKTPTVMDIMGRSFILS